MASGAIEGRAVGGAPSDLLNAALAPMLRTGAGRLLPGLALLELEEHRSGRRVQVVVGQVARRRCRPRRPVVHLDAALAAHAARHPRAPVDRRHVTDGTDAVVVLDHTRAGIDPRTSDPAAPRRHRP